MVLVTGHAVGSERDDRVGCDGVDDTAEVADQRVVGLRGAGPVGDAEQVVLVDAEDGQGRVELVTADAGQVPVETGATPTG